MKVDTREWVKKAEDDFRAALYLQLKAREFRDQIAFHCQQAAEKYLKSLLEEVGALIPKTHNLSDLLVLLLNNHSHLKRLNRGMTFLSRFAVTFRYPGESTSQRQVVAALRWAAKVRAEVRTILKLKP